MIPRISRGTDGCAIMGYLADCESPRNANVHEAPHIVAGSIGQEMAYRTLTPQDASLLGSDLNAFQNLWNTASKGHIWHCSLALKADEPGLGDETWGAVATDFMRRMGFETDGGPEVRWVAVEHGKSLKGNHHVHIAASVVRVDGQTVDTWHDYDRAQHACTELELKYGLNVLESRLAGVGSKGYSQLDAKIARDVGLPVPRPVELELRVRSLAVASQSEAEFVRRLRADGLLLRPQFREGRVTGYAVGVPALHGEKQMMYAGSKLAADLSLPKLRKSWPDMGGSQAEAHEEWSLGLPDKPVDKHGREAAPVAVDEATVNAVISDLHAEARAIPAMDRDELAMSSARLSGALAAGSRALEKTPGPLAAASRDVGAWAQPRFRARQNGKSSFRGTHGAALLFLVAMKPDSAAAEVYMWRQILAALMAVYEAHKAARPAMVMEGRMRMADGPDGMEELPEAGLTIATTAMATAIERWQRSHADGSTDEISEVEREGMDEVQIAEVDEPYANDWQPGMPGSDETLTQDQFDRVQLLTRAAGVPAAAAAVDNLSKAQASDLLRRMEETLGPDVARDALLGNGKSFRSFENGEAVWEYPKPERDVYAGANQPGVPTQRVGGEQRQQSSVAVKDKPVEQWKTGGEKLTQKQRDVLMNRGFDKHDVDGMTKAEASGYISGKRKYGDGSGESKIQNVGRRMNQPAEQWKNNQSRSKH
jgi:relaxase-like protein